MSEVSDGSPKPRRTIFSILCAGMAWIVLIAGFATAIMYSIKNHTVKAEIRQFEKELGVMHIDDPERAYIVAIENTKVPNVIADNVDRLWQFRYYLPVGYDMNEFSGSGRLAADGFYFAGDFSTGSSRPLAEAENKLLAISITKQNQQIEIYSSWGGTFWWKPSNIDVDINELVIEPIVSIGDPARSFGPREIIPLFKIYDPASAKEKIVDGQKLTTYSGATMVMLAGSQRPNFKLLRQGKRIKSAEDSEGTHLE